MGVESLDRVDVTPHAQMGIEGMGQDAEPASFSDPHDGLGQRLPRLDWLAQANRHQVDSLLCRQLHARNNQHPVPLPRGVRTGQQARPQIVVVSDRDAVEANFGGRIDVPRDEILRARSERLLTNGVGVEIGSNDHHAARCVPSDRFVAKRHVVRYVRLRQLA